VLASAKGVVESAFEGAPLSATEAQLLAVDLALSDFLLLDEPTDAQEAEEAFLGWLAKLCRPELAEILATRKAFTTSAKAAEKAAAEAKM